MTDVIKKNTCIKIRALKLKFQPKKGRKNRSE